MSARGQAQTTRWGPLGELELAILEDLWGRGADDAKGVHGRLGPARGITVNTVQSAMKRLHEKDLLRRDKVGHAYVYGPTVEREVFRRAIVEDALTPMLGGETDVMIAAFVDLAERAGADTLAQLERQVSARRKRGRSK